MKVLYHSHTQTQQQMRILTITQSLETHAVTYIHDRTDKEGVQKLDNPTERNFLHTAYGNIYFAPQ